MIKGPDDFDAVRKIVEILDPFQGPDRERILRWAREKLGMTAVPQVQIAPPPVFGTVPQTATPTVGAVTPTDIKTFISTKNPKNDTQLAATVAYFYRFLAPEEDRKEGINSGDLLEACRLAERTRPARPAQTMINAYKAGVFDKAGSGSYKLNSVGENLVAMVLPGEGGGGPPKARPTAKRGKRISSSKKEGKGRHKHG